MTLHLIDNCSSILDMSMEWKTLHYTILYLVNISIQKLTNISQGSVATCLRNGGIFNEHLLQIYCAWRTGMIKCWKSVNIMKYRQREFNFELQFYLRSE